MDFLIFSLKTLACIVFLYLLAKVSLESFFSNQKRIWICFIGFLSLANMIVNGLIDKTPNVPITTAFLFGIAGYRLISRRLFSTGAKIGFFLMLIFGSMIGWVMMFIEVTDCCTGKEYGFWEKIEFFWQLLFTDDWFSA